MIDIYICEDDASQLKAMTDCIEKYIMINDYDMAIKVSAQDPISILNYIDTDPINRKLCFLDIDLNSEINGIQLAAKIKQKDPFATIVFVTTRSEMVYTTFLYSVEAIDYIIKDTGQNIYDRVRRSLDIVYQRYLSLEEDKDCRVYTVELGESIRTFNIRDIYYFESSSNVHKVVMHHKNGEIEFYEKIKNLETIDPVFFRCHQSYVINVEHIDLIDKKQRLVQMSNGSQCLVSYRQLKPLKDYFNELTGNHKV